MRGARDFYDAKPKQTKRERNESPLLALRLYNNYIKSALICNSISHTVLDLCGGAGGDLLKFDAIPGGVSHVDLIDFSPSSVQEAQRRYTSAQLRYSAAFHCVDAFDVVAVQNALGNGAAHSYDLVNCQFAMHYAFESDASVQAFFHNVWWALRSGGKLVATFPNAQVIKRNLSAPGGGAWKTEWFTIEEEDPGAPGGAPGYIFSMGEAVQRVREPYVDLDVLRAACSQYGLVVERCAPFRDVYAGTSKRVPECPCDDLYLALVVSKP